MRLFPDARCASTSPVARGEVQEPRSGKSRSRSAVALLAFARAPERDEHVEQRRQAFLPRAAPAETRGNLVDGKRCRRAGQRLGHGAYLVHRILRPWQRLYDRGLCARGFVVLRRVRIEVGLHGLRLRLRILEFGPQPAHESARFLGRALGVERDEAFEDCFVEGALGFLARRIFAFRFPCGAGEAARKG